MYSKIKYRYNNDIKSHRIWTYNSYYLSRRRKLFSLPNDEFGFNILSPYWRYKNNKEKYQNTKILNYIIYAGKIK